jgi:hypothetical protein
VHGLSFDPLYGLILAVVIALVLLGVVLALVRRDNAETLALQGAPAGGE